MTQRAARRIAILLSTCALAWAAPASSADADDADPRFALWLEALRAEALHKGFEEATVETALADVAPLKKVIEKDRSQPVKPQGFCDYMTKRLTTTRIARGRRTLDERAELLEEISQEYGVPARYLVALWGLETNFGDYMGDHRMMDALVTLAYDPRRGAVFRSQIFGALRMVEEGHHPVEGLKASWAGATGHIQFMPNTFLAYAVDHDGDGRKDVWTSIPDALASAANYLRDLGWRTGQGWGRQVTVPAKLRSDGVDLSKRRAITDWKGLGVRRLDGGALPGSTLRGSIVLPRRKIDPAFLVYKNYRTFLGWNRSTFFALSVGTFADELGGNSALRLCGIEHLSAKAPEEGAEVSAAGGEG